MCILVPKYFKGTTESNLAYMKLQISQSKSETGMIDSWQVFRTPQY